MAVRYVCDVCGDSVAGPERLRTVTVLGHTSAKAAASLGKVDVLSAWAVCERCSLRVEPERRADRT